MRALIAFLGARAEHLESLRDHLPVLLQTADDDKDEWVQVVSGLVRRKLLQLTACDSKSSSGHEWTDHVGAYSSTVLRKTVTEVLERAARNVSDRGDKRDPVEGNSTGDSDEIGYVREAPYFNPLEERYVSIRQQPHREEYANMHFSAKYDFFEEFSEDLVSNIGSGVSNVSGGPSHAPSASSPTVGIAVPAAAASFRSGQGGSTKPSGASVPLPAPTGPNLAQARKVSLAAADPFAGSDGLRRTSKPLALARNHAGLPPGGGGTQYGSRKSNAGGVNVRNGRGGSGGKSGLMMINVDELQAIHAEKQSAREKAKGKPGRKKARVDPGEAQNRVGAEVPSGIRGAVGDPAATSTTVGDGSTEGPMPNGNAETDEKASDMDASTSRLTNLVGDAPATDAAVAVPQQGEIEAMAAMMVLGAVGGDDTTQTSYLPKALSKLLEDANSLKPEGKSKLEDFFQKKTPQGSPQERVKYHEEVSPGADGELMRVTSYIRLDFDKWVWDRVHKKKRVKS